MNKVYVLTMYRYANRDKHSYVLGVYTDPDKAIKEGKEEYEHKGHKYYPEVLGFIPDDPRSYKKILPLDEVI